MEMVLRSPTQHDEQILPESVEWACQAEFAIALQNCAKLLKQAIGIEYMLDDFRSQNDIEA
jgi:hypothetical protein